MPDSLETSSLLLTAGHGLTRIVLALLLWSATAARADVFLASMDNERVALTCDGPAVVDTSCTLALGSSGTVPVRFTTQPTRYAHLLRQGIEKALSSKQRPLGAADIAFLQRLDLSQCHPAAESKSMSGDLLQLCMPSDSAASVALFMRGLCDRCDFEPLVLRSMH